MTRPALIVLATNLTVWTAAAGAVDAGETARRILEQTNAFRAEQSFARYMARRCSELPLSIPAPAERP